MIYKVSTMFTTPHEITLAGIYQIAKETAKHIELYRWSDTFIELETKYTEEQQEKIKIAATLHKMINTYPLECRDAVLLNSKIGDIKKYARTIIDMLETELDTMFYIRVSDCIYPSNVMLKQIIVSSYIPCRTTLGFKDDFIDVGRDYYLPKKYRAAVKRCKDCNKRYVDETIAEDIGLNISYMPSNLIGTKGYCHDCVYYYTNLKQCNECHHYYEQEQLRDLANGEHVCEDCLHDSDNYVECAHCGQLFNYNDQGHYIDGEYYCDSDCAESAGYEYDSYDDEWHLPSSMHIREYHDNDYWDSFATTRRGQRNYLLFGIEIETDGFRASDLDRDDCEELIDMLDGHAFPTEDGTVEIEFVTQPHSEEAFYAFDWDSVLQKMTSMGMKSHDTSTCGQHIHFSQEFLGYTENQIKNNAKKICALFHNYWDDFVKFSRRTDDQLRWCKDHDFEITKDTDFEDLRDGRYYAVNLMNMLGGRTDTIEIRICRGTLKTSTMFANVDFFLHIVRNAKNVSWENIDRLDLWFKGIKETTKDYIRSRDCFRGEF